MIEFLYRLSDAKIFLYLAAGTVIFSLLIIILNKIFTFYTLKYDDNTTTASIASLIGIIYGVLVGLTCLYLLNNQDHALNAAMNEGTAAANIYRESKWLKGPMQHQIQGQLKTYLTNVITVEWPMMGKGKNLETGSDTLINKMADEIITYPIIAKADEIIVTNLLQEINDLFKSRQQRITINNNQLSPEIWVVVFISTILIIAINYAFKVNFSLHVFALSAFAFMASCVLFLLVTLDRPFQGEFIVEPDTLKAVLNSMSDVKDSKPDNITKR